METIRLRDKERQVESERDIPEEPIADDEERRQSRTRVAGSPIADPTLRRIRRNWLRSK